MRSNCFTVASARSSSERHGDPDEDEPHGHHTDSRAPAPGLPAPNVAERPSGHEEHHHCDRVRRPEEPARPAARRERASPRGTSTEPPGERRSRRRQNRPGSATPVPGSGSRVIPRTHRLDLDRREHVRHHFWQGLEDQLMRRIGFASAADGSERRQISRAVGEAGNEIHHGVDHPPRQIAADRGCRTVRVSVAPPVATLIDPVNVRTMIRPNRIWHASSIGSSRRAEERHLLSDHVRQLHHLAAVVFGDDGAPARPGEPSSPARARHDPVPTPSFRAPARDRTPLWASRRARPPRGSQSAHW